MRDVAALVLPDEALSENLLGLSFLSRLRRFEYSDGKARARAVAEPREGSAPPFLDAVHRPLTM